MHLFLVQLIVPITHADLFYITHLLMLLQAPWGCVHLQVCTSERSFPLCASTSKCPHLASFCRSLKLMLQVMSRSIIPSIEPIFYHSDAKQTGQNGLSGPQVHNSVKYEYILFNSPNFKDFLFIPTRYIILISFIHLVKLKPWSLRVWWRHCHIS